jgi:hypothetical protein
MLRLRLGPWRGSSVCQVCVSIRRHALSQCGSNPEAGELCSPVIEIQIITDTSLHVLQYIQGTGLRFDEIAGRRGWVLGAKAWRHPPSRVPPTTPAHLTQTSSRFLPTPVVAAHCTRLGWYKGCMKWLGSAHGGWGVGGGSMRGDQI